MGSLNLMTSTANRKKGLGSKKNPQLIDFAGFLYLSCFNLIVISGD